MLVVAAGAGTYSAHFSFSLPPTLPFEDGAEGRIGKAQVISEDGTQGDISGSTGLASSDLYNIPELRVWLFVRQTHNVLCGAVCS